MNKYSLDQEDVYVYGTIVVQVLDRNTELPASKIYVGISSNGGEEASVICCGTLVAVTDRDGCFSYRLPAGLWYLALSRTNWKHFWVPPDATVEITAIHNSSDRITRRIDPPTKPEWE